MENQQRVDDLVEKEPLISRFKNSVASNVLSLYALFGSDESSIYDSGDFFRTPAETTLMENLNYNGRLFRDRDDSFSDFKKESITKITNINNKTIYNNENNINNIKYNSYGNREGNYESENRNRDYEKYIIDNVVSSRIEDSIRESKKFYKTFEEENIAIKTRQKILESTLESRLLNVVGLSLRGASLDDMSKALTQYAQYMTDFQSTALMRRLSTDARARSEAFLEEFAQEFEKIRALSATVLDMEDGELKVVSQDELASYHPDDFMMFTSHSMDPNARELQFQSFKSGINPAIPDESARDIHKVSTALADKKARKLISSKLSDREQRKSESLVDRIDSGEEIELDVAFVGLSTHASNASSIIRYLMPEGNLGGVDQNGRPGHLWLNRGWILQNNTMGPSATDGQNLPRQGGDLFPLGDFYAIKMPFISKGRWPSGEDAGVAIRWNLNQALDEMLLDHRFTGAKKDGKRYVLTVEDVETGRERQIFSRAIAMSSIGDERNPFVDKNGLVTDGPSFALFNNEQDAIKRGEDARVYTYDSYSERLNAPNGLEYFLSEVDGKPQTIVVVGDGDGGRTVVSSLLEQIDSQFLAGRNIQAQGRRPNIVWLDQKAQTSEEYAEDSRGLYSRICSFYSNKDNIADPGKLESLRTNGGRIQVVSSTGRVYNADKVISAVGFETPDDATLFPGMKERIPVSDGVRKVASKLLGEKVYFLGPYSQIKPSDVGLDVARTFEEFGIDENNVANWFRGYATQRAAYQIARDLSKKREILQYEDF